MGSLARWWAVGRAAETEVGELHLCNQEHNMATPKVEPQLLQFVTGARRWFARLDYGFRSVSIVLKHLSACMAELHALPALPEDPPSPPPAG
jgi:hypothetical protein